MKHEVEKKCESYCRNVITNDDGIVQKVFEGSDMSGSHHTAEQAESDERGDKRLLPL
jgi:hypothetical protein